MKGRIDMPTLAIPCIAAPLSSSGIENATNALKIDEATLWAMLRVETNSCGYFVSRRPRILFERHLFSKLTKGAWDTAAPEISNPQPGGYGAGGDFQYTRLGKAYGLHFSAREAALQSTSWGLGQILGVNAASAGYVSIQEMVAAMAASEDRQLQAVVNFILANNLQRSLEARQWATYARAYNGADYAANQYDTKLAQAHALYRDRSKLPNLTIRAAQLALFLLGYLPGGIDGMIGPSTLNALHKFQKVLESPPTLGIDADVLASLTTALPPAPELSLN